MSQKDLSVQQDNLFIGTNEQIAKLAPLRGLEPPIFLTDVYTPFFCKQNCNNGERWGIISVNLNDLQAGMIAPSPDYIKKFVRTKKSVAQILENIDSHKSKWQKSLAACGVCVYTSFIPPQAIQKVMIYNNSGRECNPTINQLVDELPEPTSVTPANHKALYHKSLGISRWFNGDFIRCEDIFNGTTSPKIISEIEDKLLNRYGLDIYYLKPEEKGKKHAKK